MIMPTVGRIVHFYYDPDTGPYAAIITHVKSDRLVNLSVFTLEGTPRGMEDVILVQPEDEPLESCFCTWMPYQIKKEFGSESGEKEVGTQPI